MTFTQYVVKIDKMIVEYTKSLSKKDLKEIESSIEQADAFHGKIWLEDYVDREISGDST